MKVTYHYAQGIDVSVYLTENQDFLSQNYVWIDYSQPIRNLLNKYDRHSEHGQLRQELVDLFGDPYETVYIPAGRSILTLLGGQFIYIYSTMDDAQKRLLDSCTRDYMERVLKLRPQFANGLEGLLDGYRTICKNQFRFLRTTGMRMDFESVILLLCHAESGILHHRGTGIQSVSRISESNC